MEILGFRVITLISLSRAHSTPITHNHIYFVLSAKPLNHLVFLPVSSPVPLLLPGCLITGAPFSPHLKHYWLCIIAASPGHYIIQCSPCWPLTSSHASHIALTNPTAASNTRTSCSVPRLSLIAAVASRQ